MVDPFASDRLRRASGSATVVSPSLAALRLLHLPFPDAAAPDAPPTTTPRPLRDDEPAPAHRPIAEARRTPPSFATGYADFRDSALARPGVAASYLATIRLQADALAMVWEAHVRGAATLPASVAEAVGRAMGR